MIVSSHFIRKSVATDVVLLQFYIKMKIKKIKEAYTYWKDAVINCDLASLNRICTDNFSWTNAMGITHNKIDNLKRIASRNMQYISWTNEDTKIDIKDDMAILRTKEELKMLVFNLRVHTVQEVTAIFINNNGNWMLECGHEKRIS